MRYKFLDEFPGYRFGSDGSLWSDRERDGVKQDPKTGRLMGAKWKRTGKWKRIKVSSTSEGYRRTRLLDCRGRKPNKFIHNLVCEAFHGPRPGPYPGFHAAHKNGDPLDNRACNLWWRTARENNWVDQMKQNGTHTCFQGHQRGRKVNP